jgi:hypothetical protein
LADVILAFDIEVDKANYIVGEEVNWSVMVSLPESDNTNFGIASAAFSLEGSRGEMLRPGAVGDTFAGYSFSSGGTTSGDRLIEAGATLFVQNDALVVGADPDNIAESSLGPFLLVSGSYTPMEFGDHTLSLSSRDSSPSQYFTARGQFLEGGTQLYDDVRFGSVAFSVSAVPEPSMLVLLGAGVGAGLLVRRRR